MKQYEDNNRLDFNLEWTLEKEKQHHQQAMKRNGTSRTPANPTTAGGTTNNTPHATSSQRNEEAAAVYNDEVVQVDSTPDDQSDYQIGIIDNDQKQHQQHNLLLANNTTTTTTTTTVTLPSGEDQQDSMDLPFEHQPLRKKIRHFSFDGRMLRNRSHDEGYYYRRQYLPAQHQHQHHSVHQRYLHSNLPSYQEYRASISSHSGYSMISLENNNGDHDTTTTTTTTTQPSSTMNGHSSSGERTKLYHDETSNFNNETNQTHDDATAGTRILHPHRIDGASFFTTVSNNSNTSITSLVRRISSSPHTTRSSKSLPSDGLLQQQQHQQHQQNDTSNDQHQPKLLNEEYHTISFNGKLLVRRNSKSQSYQERMDDKSDYHGTTTNASMETSPSFTKSPALYHGPTSTAQDPTSTTTTTTTNHELDALLPNKKNGMMYDNSFNFNSENAELQKIQMDDFRMKLQGSGGVEKHSKKSSSNAKTEFVFYVIYALLNTMMSIPSLYGYASVIFNHAAFQPYISTLSKLVIWSSAVHQMSFVIFSSIPFSIAQVQDAGLLFLSMIAHDIADTITSQEGTVEEILTTTVIALGIATATLGLMLVLMGRFNCANAVSYLPLPVVGGYLAFIGYFCVIAGVGLCISKSMIDGTILTDIQILSEKKSIILATPGIISGLVMMYITRTAKSDMALPIAMVAIPSLFFAILYGSGWTLEDARRNQWVGEETPPASLTILFESFDISLVRWDLIFSTRCITVWLSMVFVVSFSSCLDVAAISMDMGEPLNVNQELITVGLSNFISGVCLGQTGSYIFSQTILTYRTGFHARWTGFLCVLMFLYFVVSTVNLLDISPLFFLGSTLIFIGFDLLYEWIIEVAHKLNLSEYLVVLATFVAIQIVGINGGIVFGIIVAIVEYAVTTSQVPSLRRVIKRSRTLWDQQHRRFIQDTVYDSRDPKIVTLEITETVFFGSSLLLLSQICDEIGLAATSDELDDIVMSSPGNHSGRFGGKTRDKRKSKKKKNTTAKQKPRYVVLEMSQVANVDASAARSCFLQLAKMCSKNGVVLCAAGANSRVEWILRSHDVTYTTDEEDMIKRMMLDPLEPISQDFPTGKLILFSNINECLELCENQLIYEYQPINLLEPPKLGSNRSASELMSLVENDSSIKIPLSKIFERVLGMEESHDRHLLKAFDEGGVAKVAEKTLSLDQKLFVRDEISDCFYVVLRGTIRISRSSIDQDQKVSKGQRSLEGEASYVNVGQIFGYVDFALQRRRSFNAVCEECNTLVAKISQSTIDRLKRDNKDLHHIIDKVLLQASLLELANIDVC